MRNHDCARLPCDAEAQGFEQVLDLVEDACKGLLIHIAGLPKKQATR